MTVAPAAWVAAAAAGIATALLAWRGLRGGPAAAAVLASVLRGAAVAIAVIAAFGPYLRTTSRVAGRTLVASPRGDESVRGDLALRWPAENADGPFDAAAAVETLRASRDATTPANLVLVAGADLGRGSDAGPATNAMRDGRDLRRFVRPLADPPAVTPLRAAPRITAPGGATEGVPVALTIDAGDEPLGAAEARVAVDGRPVTVAIAGGARRVATPPMDLAAGTHVVVADVAGRLPAAAIVDVAGPPRVLVVSADGAPNDFAAMLRTQGMDVADVRAGDLRTDDVDRCAAIVLGPGVAGDSLCASVAARVRGGAGLVVIGGDGKAGLSRFLGTAVDPLLPVVPPPVPVPPPPPPTPPPPEKKPDPKTPKPSVDEGEKEAYRVALLLIIDTSGSMSGTKLQMAQRAAIAAAGALSPHDRVGVVAFDEDARVLAPFQDATDLDTLFRKVTSLRLGNRTNFAAALRIGYPLVLAEKCGIRHVIFMTDGCETVPGLVEGAIRAGAKQMVTLSTVAIGNDEEIDGNRLARMVEWGRGKMYRATDVSRLPEVVTEDTGRFAVDVRTEAKRKDRPKVDADDLPAPPAEAPPVPTAKAPPAPPAPPAEVATAKRPHIVSPAALLAGLENAAWPQLPFAETTPARPASQVVLAFDDATPALTLGRAGLGRVAVISAGAASREAGAFRQWESAPQFVAQLVRAMVEPPAPGAEPAAVEFVAATDGRAFVRVAVPGGGELSLDPMQSGGPIATRCADRGAYSIAELGAMPPAGVYAGAFAAPGATPRRAVAVSAGPRPLAPGVPQRVASVSGAEVVNAVPPPGEGVPVERDEPREFELAAAAAGLLVVETALRRAARRTA